MSGFPSWCPAMPSLRSTLPYCPLLRRWINLRPDCGGGVETWVRQGDSPFVKEKQGGRDWKIRESAVVAIVSRADGATQ